jgi:hypothetical protein
MYNNMNDTLAFSFLFLQFILRKMTEKEARRSSASLVPCWLVTPGCRIFFQKSIVTHLAKQ